MAGDIPDWAKGLNDEDWQFIKRLLLASGSLKDIAKQYGISYPTVRARLDKLIEKVQILDSKAPRSKFHKTVQLLVAEGRLDIMVARKLLREFKKEVNEKE